MAYILFVCGLQWLCGD